MPKFFDEYNEFYTTSKTTANSKRLNFRYHTIIEQNSDLLQGKRVVEVACHDGRWAFAAIKGGGASHVTGIEPRQHLINNANKTFANYGMAPETHNFICGDGFVEVDRMVREGEQYDVGMCLGFLYHTARQYEIIYKLSKLNVKTLILDTAVLENVTGPYVRVGMENTQNEARLHEEGKTVGLGGVPSISAMHLMIKAAGFQPRMVTATIPPPENGCNDYREGRRYTFVGTR